MSDEYLHVVKVYKRNKKRVMILNLPKGTVIKYRILTEKSILGVGRYKDLTVGDVLRYDPTYIPYAYYCIEKISFCDDILDLFNCERINKPGTDEDALKRWKRDFYESMSEDDRLKRIAHIRKKAKAIQNKRIATVNFYNNFSKARLTQANHGHNSMIKTQH